MADQIRMSRRAALGSASAALFLLGNAKGLKTEKLRRGETGRVTRIIDGDSFVMESGNQEISVRLSTIQGSVATSGDGASGPGESL